MNTVKEVVDNKLGGSIKTEPPNTLSYNERKEFNKLEKEISKLGIYLYILSIFNIYILS